MAQKFKPPRRYVFDIETDGFVEKMTRIHSVVLIDADTEELLSFADQPGYRPISEGLEVLRTATEIIGHNIIGFDIEAIQKLHPEWEPEGVVTDTLILSRLLEAAIDQVDQAAIARAKHRGQTPALPAHLAGSHSLEAWGYRLGYKKDDFGKTTDWSEWTKSMQDYCEQDVRLNVHLYRSLIRKHCMEEWAKSIDIEHRFARLMKRQEVYGFRFDTKAAERLEAVLRTRKAEVASRLATLFAPWWVNLGEWAMDRDYRRFIEHPEGAVLRTIQRETGETYTHTFKNGRTTERKVKEEVQQRGFWEEVDACATYCKVELRVFNPTSRHHIADRLQKLYGWRPSEFTASGQVKIDDDVLSALDYEPAKVLAEVFMLDKRLGQLADGRQAWLKQSRNGRIHGRINTLGAITGRCTHSNPNVAQVPSIHNAKGLVPYGRECRSLFTADVGHVLIGSDADGLELRCLAHFISDGGRYARAVSEGKKSDGTDIHTVNQKASGLPSRDAAKTFIYAFLYGAGDQKLGSIILPNGTEDEQKAAGDALRRKFLRQTPGLRGLIVAVKQAAKDKGWLRGIDGRRVYIRSAHAALNSLLQNAGAVAMKLAPVLLYERLIAEGYEWGRDFAFVAHVHDEMQLSVREDLKNVVAEMAVWSIEEAGRQLGFRCPLTGGADIGSSWAETH